MAQEQRWPRFAAAAHEAGVGAMLSLQLYVEGDSLGSTCMPVNREASTMNRSMWGCYSPPTPRSPSPAYRSGNR
jgi:hypothetical protein